MDGDLSEQVGKQVRREARQAAAQASEERADDLTHQVMQESDLKLLPEIKRRLEVLGDTWPVHEQRPLTRVPLIGPLLAWLGARLTKFLLQNQIGFNAEVTRTLKEMHQVQQLMTREQIERTDQLFSYLDEKSLALEARLRDLEDEVERLQQ
jgi:hypothetical protein